jgi:eukaryotic-like serine/threonine-protein kinase
MSESGSTHPTDEELRAMSSGRLGEAELARVCAHLGDCPECCRRIDQLAAADPLLARLQQSASRREETPVSPAQRRLAVRALRRWQAARADTESKDAGTEPVILPMPAQVGDYDVLAEVGRGGMGVVYKARHRGLHRLAALKMILAGEFASPAQKLRFRLEAELAARVRHPNIVQVYEIGSYQGRPFLALEWVEGGSLAGRLDGQPWPPGEAASLLETLARAIHVAHGEGVVHRDLKPANILLQEDDGGGREDRGEWDRSGSTAAPPSHLLPKITDFGLARPTEGGTTLTQTGLLVGTPGYMAPEQADSSGRRALVGPATDVYALGVVLYQLLTGQLPFRGDSTLEVLRAVTSDEPVRPRRLQPRVPRDLEAITLHCLEKEPNHRYSSALALAEDLQQFREGKPVAARPVGWGARLARACRRRPLVALLLGLLMASLFGGMAGVTWKWLEANEQRDRANANGRQAETEKQAALHQAYRARLAAATAALQYHDVDDAARQLKEAPEEWRGWEWRHLNARLDDSDVVLSGVQVLRRALSGFRLAAFTPDALVVSGEDGRRIFSIPRRDVPAGAVIHFSDDTAWLAAEILDHAEGVIRLRESTGQERLLRLPPGRRGVRELHFSPDGQRLAVVLGGQDMSICDVSTCRETAHLPPPPADLNALAFSEDGRRLAVAADAPVVSVWDTDTGRVVVELRTRGPRVMRVAFHPRGDRLLTASHDGTVQQWDLPTGDEVGLPYERHEGEVRAVAYSPDGQRVASAGVDRTVRLWRAEGRQDEAVLHGHTRTVVELAFSRDGRRPASCQSDGVARLWDSGPDATLPVLRGHTSYVYPVAYTADGRLIASGAWELASTRDGRRLASRQYDGVVRLWDAATGEAVAVLPQGGIVRALALSPDGKRLVTMGDETDGLRVWDVASGRQIATYKTAENRLWAVAYRPGGTHLAVLGPGHVIEVLDATTGRRVATADAGARLEYWATRRALAYSPDGRLLAGPYEGNQVGLWEADTYRLVGTLTGHEGTVLSVAFNADGRLLASGGADSLIKVWDVASRDCRLTLPGHADEVFAAVFHPDGSRIASGGRDRLVRLWDAATGEELVRLPGHSDYVYSLAFSPDGKSLASGSGDNTVRLWDTSPLKARYQARREAESLRPEAQRLVERLWRQNNDPAAIIETLRADPALSEPLRHAAQLAVLRRAMPPGSRK